MPREIVSVKDRYGGHNSLTGELSFNTLHTRNNTVLKRLGTAKISDDDPVSAGKVVGLHKYYQQDGDEFIIRARDDTGTVQVEWCDFSGSPDVWTDIIPSPTPAGLTTGYPVMFLTYFDKLFFVNGKEAPFVWDGAGDAAYVAGIPGGWGSPFAPRYIAGFKNRLFYGLGNYVYFSDAGYSGSGLDYESSSIIDALTDDGDFITGLVPQDDFLAIFKQNSIHTVYGNSPIDFLKPNNIYQQYGAHAPRSIVPVGPYIFFLHKEGIFIFDGRDVIPIPVSTAVRTELENIPDNRLKYAAACLWNGFYVLSYTLSGGTYNNRIMFYNVMTGENHVGDIEEFGRGWSIWPKLPASCFYVEKGLNDTGSILFGNDDSSGYCRVYRYPTGTKDNINDVETDVVMTWRQRLPRMEPHTREKTCYGYELEARGLSGSPTITIMDSNFNQLDQSSIQLIEETGTVFDTGTFDSITVGGEPEWGSIYEGGFLSSKAKRLSFEIKDMDSLELEILDLAFEIGVSGEKPKIAAEKGRSHNYPAFGVPV